MSESIQPIPLEESRPKLVIPRFLLGIIATIMLGCSAQRQIDTVEGKPIVVNIEPSMRDYADAIESGIEEAANVFEQHLDPSQIKLASIAVKRLMEPVACGRHNFIDYPTDIYLYPDCGPILANRPINKDLQLTAEEIIKEIAFHEAFHVLVQFCEKRIIEDKSILYNKTAEIVSVSSVQGPRVILTNPRGEIEPFTDLEEATIFLNNTLPIDENGSSHQYKAFSDLLRGMIDFAGIDEETYLNFVLNSRLEEFMALVFNKPVDQLTDKDWELFIDVFDQINVVAARTMNPEELYPVVEGGLNRIRWERLDNAESKKIKYEEKISAIIERVLDR